MEETGPPQGDGVSATTKFGGDGAVGGPILLGQAENNPAAEGEGLWRGRRPGEGLELAAEFGGQTHDRGVGNGHGDILAEAGRSVIGPV